MEKLASTLFCLGGAPESASPLSSEPKILACDDDASKRWGVYVAGIDDDYAYDRHCQSLVLLMNRPIQISCQIWRNLKKYEGGSAIY